MKVLLLFTTLFWVITIYSIFDNDTADTIAGFCFSGMLSVIYLFFRNEAKKAKDFINWVDNNRYYILDEGADYEGFVIDKDTEVTQFHICLSFIAISIKIPTRYFIREYHNPLIISILCSCISFIGGWWGIPWGPIFTVQIIGRNITGGKKTTIMSLLKSIDENDEKIRQQYIVGRN